MLDIIDVPNSNQKARKTGVSIDTLVVHGHGEWVVDQANDAGGGKGRVWHCTDWLRAIGLSVHAWCLPDGRIVREVDSWRKAFHAGGWNSRSIGMEFVVPGVWTYDEIHRAWETGEPDLYTEAQFNAGLEWYLARASEHGLPRAAKTMRAHWQIDPGRKVDPGRQFPLERFVSAFVG